MKQANQQVKSCYLQSHRLIGTLAQSQTCAACSPLGEGTNLPYIESITSSLVKPVHALPARSSLSKSVMRRSVRIMHVGSADRPCQMKCIDPG